MCLFALLITGKKRFDPSVSRASSASRPVMWRCDLCFQAIYARVGLLRLDVYCTNTPHTHTHPHTHTPRCPFFRIKEHILFHLLAKSWLKAFTRHLCLQSQGDWFKKVPRQERHSTTLNRPRLECLCEKNESIQWNSLHHTANCCPCFYIFISPQLNFWAWGEPVQISTDLSNYCFPLDRGH